MLIDKTRWIATLQAGPPTPAIFAHHSAEPTTGKQRPIQGHEWFFSGQLRLDAGEPPTTVHQHPRDWQRRAEARLEPPAQQALRMARRAYSAAAMVTGAIAGHSPNRGGFFAF